MKKHYKSYQIIPLRSSILKRILLMFVLGKIIATAPLYSEETGKNPQLDQQVNHFLASKDRSWRNANVSEVDGRVLYNLIIENNYTSALEVGTSTGHSTIWIAWALSKTGGKLITIEINETRHQQAQRNLEEAGLSEYVDFRLDDAHELVAELTGPFDFIFVDADKSWYPRYLEMLGTKLEIDGCFTAHNVLNTDMPGIREFLELLTRMPAMETTIDRSSWSGISVSYKRKKH